MIMNKIVYYVAISIDGFICGLNGDISGFVGEGSGVTKYLSDLKKFETTIMGKDTYEFGYAYGLKPGQPAYEHMQHFIFSKTLQFDTISDQVHIIADYDLDKIQELKKNSTTDIYLCGGGVFAGWLFDNQLIDIIKVKINPLVLGEGVRLFSDSKQGHQLELTETESHDGGLIFNTYKVKYY